jgi:hypothetical protein
MLRGLSPNSYFFLPLDVFFAVFFAAFAVFAFFAFLAMFLSASWLNANRPSTCMHSDYTIIAKLIPRASKTVNEGHTASRLAPDEDVKKREAHHPSTRFDGLVAQSNA